MTFNEITLSAAFFAQLDERVSVFWCRQDDVTQLKPYVSDNILCDSKKNLTDTCNFKREF